MGEGQDELHVPGSGLDVSREGLGAAGGIRRCGTRCWHGLPGQLQPRLVERSDTSRANSPAWVAAGLGKQVGLRMSRSVHGAAGLPRLGARWRRGHLVLGHDNHVHTVCDERKWYMAKPLWTVRGVRSVQRSLQHRRPERRMLQRDELHLDCRPPFLLHMLKGDVAAMAVCYSNG